MALPHDDLLTPESETTITTATTSSGPGPVLAVRIGGEWNVGAGTLAEMYGIEIGDETMADEVTKELLEARIENTELKTDLKFEQLSGKLDLIVQGQTHLNEEIGKVRNDLSNNRSVYIGLILGSALAVAALVIGFFAFGIQILELAAGIFASGQGLPKP